MYYEQGSGRRERPGFCGGLFRLLLITIVVWALLGAGWTYVMDSGWTHVLLLGVDYDENGTSRSDTIIIASISPLGKVRLTSILRDTWVDIPGHGEGKINAAYRYGGAELTMQTVNQALGLNIGHYVTISLRAFPLLVDELGGIELDITKDELAEVNSNLDATRRLLAKYSINTESLDEWGESVHVTGAQALSYARIRHIGDDYARTARQREVLSAMLAKARRTWNPVRLTGFFRQALTITDRSVVWPHMAYLGVAALIQNDVQQLRLPAEGTYESGTFSGTWCIKPDWSANRATLNEFLR